MYGKDIGYARTRLVDTIVRKGEHPVVVKEIDREGTVHYETVITRKQRTCKLSELNLASPELGMTNTTSGAMYLSRCPKRDDWRHGLRRNNVSSLWGGHGDVSNKLIYKAIRGRFPSFEEAVETAMVDEIVVAFHRHWAVRYDQRRRTLKLIYKWFDVAGTINEDGTGLALIDSERFAFSNLYEAFEEALNEKS